MMDCFGRQRHAAHRDDMDGVGSFMKPCRTLFVANLLKSKYDSPKQLEGKYKFIHTPNICVIVYCLYIYSFLYYKI